MMKRPVPSFVNTSAAWQADQILSLLEVAGEAADTKRADLKAFLADVYEETWFEGYEQACDDAATEDSWGAGGH